MYKNTSLVFPLEEEIQKNNQYTNVSEKEARELAFIVQEMYKNNDISYQATQIIHHSSSPEASITINRRGITFRLGLNRKSITITTLTPKGDLK